MSIVSTFKPIWPFAIGLGLSFAFFTKAYLGGLANRTTFCMLILPS